MEYGQDDCRDNCLEDCILKCDHWCGKQALTVDKLEPKITLFIRNLHVDTTRGIIETNLDLPLWLRQKSKVIRSERQFISSSLSAGHTITKNVFVNGPPETTSFYCLFLIHILHSLLPQLFEWVGGDNKLWQQQQRAGDTRTHKNRKQRGESQPLILFAFSDRVDDGAIQEAALIIL